MQNPNLTPKERQILNYIKETITNKGFPPTIREIAKAVSLKSTSTVHDYIIRLEEKGALTRISSSSRGIFPTNFNPSEINIPLIGTIAAGTPIFAEENIEEYLPVPPSLIGKGNHFILRVKGDSMIESGIWNGDMVIVRQQSTASNGEIVAALVGNEATIKRYYKREGYIELMPENTQYKPIRVYEVKILGKVVGLLRSL